MSDTQHAHADAALEIAALIEERAARAAKSLPENAGKPYCPSSGSEGAAFEDAFCCRCQYYGSERGEPSDCPILMQAHIVADVHDPEFPNQWVYDEEGYPTCRMFSESEDAAPLCGGARTPEQERELYEKAKRGEA